jgi:hypothetical protein
MIRGQEYTHQLNKANGKNIQRRSSAQDLNYRFHHSIQQIIHELTPPSPSALVPELVTWKTSNKELAKMVYKELMHSNLMVTYNHHPWSAESHLYEFHVFPQEEPCG